MPEQIILEFIGDPSGLRPAEDALKSLGKAAQDTIDAFNKSNDAAKRYAESLSTITDSLEDTNDMSVVMTKSFSGLSQTITTNNIKSATTDLIAMTNSLSSAADRAEEAKKDFADFEKNVGTLKMAFTELSKSATQGTEKITAYNNKTSDSLKGTIEMVAGAKKLTSSLGEVGAEIAHLTGNQEKSNEITRVTGEIMGALSAAETAATTAQWALNEAMSANPVLLLVTAVGALIGAWSILSNNTAAVKKEQEAWNKVVEDGIAITERRAEVLRTGHDRSIAVITNEIELARAQRKPIQEIMDLEEQRAQAQKRHAKVLLESVAVNDYVREHYADINAEIATQLDRIKEIDKAISERQKNSDSNHSERNIGKKSKEALENEKAEAEEKIRIKKNQIDTFDSMEKDRVAADAAVAQADATRTNVRKDQSLRDSKAYYDTLALQARESSKARLEDDLKAIDAGAEIQRRAVMTSSASQTEINLIDAQAVDAKKKRNEKYAMDQLSQDKALAQLESQFMQADNDQKLVLLDRMVDDEYQMKVASYERDRAAMIKAGEQKTAEYKKNEEFITALQAEAAEKHKRNAAAIANEKLQIELRAQLDIQRTMLSFTEAGSKSELQVKKAMIYTQAQMEISSATVTIHNQLELAARIVQIWSTANRAVLDLQTDLNKKAFDNSRAQAQAKNALAASEKNVDDPSKFDFQKDQEKINILKKQEEEITAAKKKLKEEDFKTCEEFELAETNLKKEGVDKRNEITNAEYAQNMKIMQSVLGVAVQFGQMISDAAFENSKQQRDNALQDTLDGLNQRKEAELTNQSLTNSQKKAIDAKYRREEAQAKLQAWKADQQAKVEQALINGALAFTMSLAQLGLPGLATGAIALASAAVQAGIIASKAPPKFAKGVVALEGPGSTTSDSIHAMLSRGESVITARATEKYKPLLHAMNAGTFDHMYPHIPRPADLSALLRGTGVSQDSAFFDYERLGKEVARNIPTPVINSIRMDENGFSKHIQNRSTKTEIYNNRHKF